MDQDHSMIPKSLELEDVSSSGLSLCLLITAVSLLLLPLEELVCVYTHLVSLAALGSAALTAHQYAQEETKHALRAKYILVPTLEDGLVPPLHLLGFYTRRHLCPILSYITLTWLV